jgi:hypothetical protein
MSDGDYVRGESAKIVTSVNIGYGVLIETADLLKDDLSIEGDRWFAHAATNRLKGTFVYIFRGAIGYVRAVLGISISTISRNS